LKNHLLVLASAALFVAPLARAIPIQIGIGPNGVVTQERFSTGFDLKGIPFQGQNASIDFTFKNDAFIRLFTATKFFFMDIFMRINDAPFSVFKGTGDVFGREGNALGPAQDLTFNPVTNGADQLVGMDIVFAPSAGNLRPVDFYGIHLELTLPLSPGFEFVGTNNSILFAGNTFGIGPKVPRDVIPETGGTIGFFMLGLIAVAAGKSLASRPVQA